MDPEPFSRRRTHWPIGIDIGSCAVRAVQLARQDDRLVVEGSARAERTPGADEADADACAGAVQRCMGQRTFRGCRAVAAVTSPHVEFHALELPATLAELNQREAANVVRLEVTRLMTFAEESVETRHWHLPETGATVTNTIGVAARREAVVELVELCAQAGLVCHAVDTCACALSRFGRAIGADRDDTGGEEPPAIWGMLDLGLQKTQLVLCLEDVPVLVRNVGEGGGALSALIADTLNISIQAADIHKRDHGISSAPGAARGVRHSSTDRRDIGPGGSQLASIILGVLRSSLNGLATEVKRSYEYALACYPGRPAGQLVLVGGGARMRNLPEFLGNALGINVRAAGSLLADDRCHLRASFASPYGVEEFAVAIGLAMGG
jgi:type IV pilus assembly protein PilM